VLVSSTASAGEVAAHRARAMLQTVGVCRCCLRARILTPLRAPRVLPSLKRGEKPRISALPQSLGNRCEEGLEAWVVVEGARSGSVLDHCRLCAANVSDPARKACCLPCGVVQTLAIGIPASGGIGYKC